MALTKVHISVESISFFLSPSLGSSEKLVLARTNVVLFVVLCAALLKKATKTDHSCKYYNYVYKIMCNVFEFKLFLTILHLHVFFNEIKMRSRSALSFDFRRWV